MQLPTIEFLLFFSLVFFVSILVRNKPFIFSLVLLASSIIFYASWDLTFIALIVIEILATYLSLVGIYSHKPLTKKISFILGIIVVIGFWFTFKYYNFFALSLFELFQGLRIPVELPLLQIVAPLGISFYSFKIYSHLFDSFKRKVETLPTLLNYANFISFFPQISAGPIMKAQEFYPQISAPYSYRVEEVLILLFTGFVKKVIIGSFLFDFIRDPFVVPTDYASLDLLIAAVGYSALIYVDFSGYNDIATAISQLLGFSVPSNFNMPYQSNTLAEFWRRWHTTLGRWLKDYIYIPLGGSRKGTIRKYINLLITFTFSGLWHGVGFNFMIWGALHGIGLCVDDVLRKVTGRFYAQFEGRHKTQAVLSILGSTLGWGITLSFVILSRIFFNTPTIEKALEYWQTLLFGQKTTLQLIDIRSLSIIAFVFLLNFIEIPLIKGATNFLAHRSTTFKVIVFVILIYIAMEFMPELVAPFIYYKF